MGCEQCHLLSSNGRDFALPNVKECMSCHRTVIHDDPAIQKLSALERSGEPIAWVRIYTLPGFVFFNHQTHQNAKVGCGTCHGAVADRDALRQEKDISMAACGTCHSVGY
jgi:hypothetical protein